MKCDCYFCQAGKAHPGGEYHSEFERMSDRLLKAESTDPADRVQVWFCTTCGHKEERQN